MSLLVLSQLKQYEVLFFILFLYEDLRILVVVVSLCVNWLVHLDREVRQDLLAHARRQAVLIVLNW